MTERYRPKGRSAYIRARLAEILDQVQPHRRWRRALREIADILAP